MRKALREVSINGCEMIGSGGYGKVYRIDSETIVKIYNLGISLEFVEQERTTSQKAFLMGVPTVISYGTLLIRQGYGMKGEERDMKKSGFCGKKFHSKLFTGTFTMAVNLSW